MTDELYDLQKAQAQKLYEFSDLNGLQVEDASGWESVDSEESQHMWRTLYITPELDWDVTPVFLTVHFQPDSHLISAAYVGGVRVIDLTGTDKN